MLLWCLLDFALVRFAPSRMHDFDGLLLLFPAGVWMLGNVAIRRANITGSAGILSVAATLVASVVAVALVLTFGIAFHFAIGGKL